MQKLARRNKIPDWIFQVLLLIGIGIIILFLWSIESLLRYINYGGAHTNPLRGHNRENLYNTLSDMKRKLEAVRRELERLS